MKRRKQLLGGPAGDRGAALLMVLVVVTVVALAGAAMLSFSDTSIRTTVALRDQGAGAYAAEGAAQVAISRAHQADLPNNCATQAGDPAAGQRHRRVLRVATERRHRAECLCLLHAGHDNRYRPRGQLGQQAGQRYSDRGGRHRPRDTSRGPELQRQASHHRQWQRHLQLLDQRIGNAGGHGHRSHGEGRLARPQGCIGTFSSAVSAGRRYGVYPRPTRRRPLPCPSRSRPCARQRMRPSGPACTTPPP